eukprot:7218626-Alexandrium_andersonii.AAC.1
MCISQSQQANGTCTSMKLNDFGVAAGPRRAGHSRLLQVPQQLPQTCTGVPLPGTESTRCGVSARWRETNA